MIRKPQGSIGRRLGGGANSGGGKRLPFNGSLGAFAVGADSAILDDYRKFESVGFVEEKERKNLGVEWRSLVEK